MKKDFFVLLQELKKIKDEEIKRKILSEAVSYLFSVIPPDDILKENSDGTWNYLNRQLTIDEISQIKQEATEIRKMILWKVINTDIQYQIGIKIWKEGKVDGDLFWGQIATWLWDIIKTRISRI